MPEDKVNISYAHNPGSMPRILLKNKSLKVPKGNQNPLIEEGQTKHWSKETGQKNKQRSTKHKHQTKDRVAPTPLKPDITYFPNSSTYHDVMSIIIYHITYHRETINTSIRIQVKQEPEVNANEYPSCKKNLHIRSEYTHIHGCR
jgi:hypothetical protein